MNKKAVNDNANNILKESDWFIHRRDGTRHNILLGTLCKVAIGAAIGFVLFLGRYKMFAITVWCISAIIGLISLSSRKTGVGLARFFAVFGEYVGRIVGVILLTTIYLLIFPIIRVSKWLKGSDPLQLRDDGRQTFWLECDKDIRKRRYISSMFSTENLAVKRRSKLVFLVILVVMVVFAEFLLRTFGVGNPIVYVNDPIAGFYPAPNQNVSRYGNQVSTNQFGMRAPNYTAAKRQGNFRILMIGDSTLWGGSYIGQEKIYARLVEKHLNSECSNGQVEVLNIGVNAWGPFHKLGYIEKFGTFDADVAILCLPFGNVYRPLYGLAEVPFFSTYGPPQFALEEVFFKLVWRYRMQLIGPSSFESKQIQAKRGIEAYARLARLLSDRGCEVFVEILPSRTAGLSETVPAEEQKIVSDLREVLKAHGYTIGYPVGFASQKGDSATLYHDKCHLHWKGHQLYADYLKSNIISQSKRFRDWHSSQLSQATQVGGNI